MSATQIVRLFTRESGSTVADTTLDSTAPAEVVVELEANDVEWGLAAMFTTGLTIKDLDNGGDVTYAGAPVSGNMGVAPWTSQAQSFAYAIDPADLAPHAGHVCEAHAYLHIGPPTAHETYLAVSPMFLVA